MAPSSGVAGKLSVLIRFPTVSSWKPGEEEGGAFSSLLESLPRLFPTVHERLARDLVGDRGLVYEWAGSDPGLPPVILCAHFDVVPADDGPEWRHGPFSGEIAEGAVWGRGAQDVKVTLACALEAAEVLLQRGFSPRRTILFCFGGDEETGGQRGAGRIAAALGARKLRTSLLLDEGDPVSDGALHAARGPVALVGIAEKGYLDIVLEARGKGGHASRPPARTAAGNIARAVAAVEDHPFPGRLCPAARSFLGRIAPRVPFPRSLAYRNLWLFSPLVVAALGGDPATNALVRTTCAPTMLGASPKENVLADRASALLNARILPGEDAASVLERVAGMVRPFGVSVRPAYPEGIIEPLPESPVGHEGFRAIEAALSASFPDAVAAPYLFCASTDTRHYRRVAGAMYRLTPLFQSASDLEGVHGRDERVALDNLDKCLAFYEALIGGL